MSNQAKGVSMTLFIAGIIISILASSLLSVVITSRLVGGSQGPPGEQGEPGLPGVAASKVARDWIIMNETLNFVDIANMTALVDINSTSDLLILVSMEVWSAHDDQLHIQVWVDNERADPKDAASIHARTLYVLALPVE